MAIVKRLVKGSALTHAELDGNFTDLDGRVTTLESAPDSDSQTLTLAGDDLTITGGNTVSLSTLSTEVVDDTSPQLGGNLDLNGNQITGSGGSLIKEELNALSLVGGSNGIVMRTTTDAGITIGDQAGNVVLGNSANSVEFVNGVGVDFTNTNIDFTSATITGLSIVQGIDDLSDVDTSTTPPGVGQVLKWDGVQWEPANDSSGSGGITLSALSVVSASASASPSLVYNNVTGVFTYTPPNLSELATDLDINGNDITGTGNINITGSITSTAVGTPTITSATDIIFSANSGSGIVNASGSKITNLGTPTAGTDAATKAYVDSNGGAPLAFVGIAVAGQTQVLADGNADTLTFEAGDGMIITTDSATDTTIFASDTTWDDLGDKNNANGPSIIALGALAGETSQGTEAIAIGKQAGKTSQGNTAVAIGESAGKTSQGLSAIAIGTGAATTDQGGAAIAIGNGTAVNNQGESAIAIGNVAVLAGQGDNAIAIGNRAGGFVNPQAATSIILNATGTQIENTTADSFVVKPVRNASGTHSMEYNPTTGEITYDTLASGGLPTRSTATGTTSSLADAAQADLDITGFKSYALLTITTDRAARVRLYVSAATRTADAARAEGVDPTSDAGVIAEVITTGADTVIISPGAYGFNLESSPTTNIPCRVTNKSGGTSTVQVDLNILQLEA